MTFRWVKDTCCMYEAKLVNTQHIKNLRDNFLIDRNFHLEIQIFERRCINRNTEQNVEEGYFLGVHI